METPQKTVNVVILVLTQQGVQKIGEALGEIPTKFGAPLIDDINAQIKLISADPGAFIKMMDQLLIPIRAKLEPPTD